MAPWATHFAYPFRWFFSVLNAVDYFRSATLLDGSDPDLRMADAIEAIRSSRRADGTWLQERRHPGRVWFEVDVDVGEPSKWLTFYASRALRWWDGLTGRDVSSTRLSVVASVPDPSVSQRRRGQQASAERG